MEVNVTGTVCITELLCTHITKGGKVVNISSQMGAISSCPGPDSVAYRISKAALNMYTRFYKLF